MHALRRDVFYAHEGAVPSSRNTPTVGRSAGRQLALPFWPVHNGVPNRRVSQVRQWV
jgi:hypothetical protein